MFVSPRPNSLIKIGGENGEKTAGCQANVLFAGILNHLNPHKTSSCCQK
jgi:hypothetical protein